MDEANGYIYAVSSEANSLLFIRMSDLQIEKKVTLGIAPSDLVQSGSKIYVALSGTKAIAIVDIAQKEVVGSINTSIKPYELAIDGNKLFYTEYRSSGVASYDLTTQAETMLDSGSRGDYAEPDLAVDTVNHILFIGESGSTGSKLFSYSTSTLQPLSKINYRDGYGFGFPARKVIVDGNQVFYAGYRFKNTDLTSIQGTYQEDAMYVHGNTVFTSHSFNSGNAAPDHSYVYDREGFTQIAELPVASRKILMDSQNHVYSYTGSDGWNPNIPNVIQIINVNLAPSTPPVSWQTDGQKLVLDKSVTDLVYSSDGANLFAIYSESNQLMRIRTSDMTVQETRTIGSNPNSLFIDHDKLYIGNASATQIMKVDTLSETSVNGAVYSWDVGNFVSQVVYGNQKLIYTASNPGIKVIDTVTGTRANYATNINSGRMILSLGDNALYFGKEEYYSTSTAIKFDLTNFSQQAVSQAYSNALGVITMNGNDLYYASYLLDKNTLLPIPAWKGYFGAAIIAAKGADIFAKDSVWNRDSYTMQYHLPFIAKNVLNLPNGQIVVVSEDGKTLQKFTSMQALHDSAPEFNPPSLAVSDVNFYDNDPIPGEISGNINWHATPSVSIVTSYTVYFLDQNKNKIGNKITEVPYNANSSYYTYRLPNTDILVGAKYLGIYAKNAIGESSSAATVELSDYVDIPPTDGGEGGPYPYFSYTLEDQNPIRGKIHPLVSWYNPNETRYSGYQLSFSNASGTQIGNVYSVSKHTSPGITYRVDVAENIVPAGAIYMDMRPKDLKGNVGTELYRMQIFDNTTSSPVIVGTNPAIPTPNILLGRSLDEDVSQGSFGGWINWYEASLEGPATSYALYFVDGNNVKLQSIAEVTRSNLIRLNQGFNNPSYEITLPSGTAIPSGAVRIGIFGKNSQGESPNGFYFGFWDKIDADPGSDYFEDLDARAGKIDGVLHWIPVVNETAVNKYFISFLDSRLDSIGPPFAEVNKGQQRYSLSIKDTQIPAGAWRLMLWAMNSANDRYVLGFYNLTDNIASEPISTLPTESQPLMVTVNQTDYDGDVGEIGGTISFNSSMSSNSTTRFDIYFVDEQLKKLKAISSLPKSEIGIYEANIPMNTQIPLGATRIAVYAVSSTGMSMPVTTSIIDRAYGPSLTPDQIEITNNKSGTSDTITVSGLNYGDIVRVYRDSASANSFLLQAVAPNATSLNFTIPQLGTGEGSLYFSVQHGDGLPSIKIAKAYKAEPAALGGGGGGGVGGGGVSLPTRDANGKMTYAFQPAHVDMLIDLAKEANKELILDATVKQHLDITTVSFEGDIAQNAANKGKPIVIKANDVQFKFPVSSLSGAYKFETVKLTIASNDIQIFGDFATASPVLEFSLGEKDKAITTFDTPIEATFHYDQSKVTDARNLGVYWLDETTNTWTYMGGKVNGDGTITATLSHFSKYAVLEKIEMAVKTFTDTQGHWAQKDIEQLVGKKIIDGMDDQSFQPDSNMTRAQFVTILKKALNLSPQATTKAFEDVAADSWYVDAVNAAYAANIVEGTSDSTFSPEANVTREQLAVMIVNAYLNVTGKKLSNIVSDQPNGYVDASSMSEWAKQYVAAATTLGLLNGVDDTHFAPSQNSTRAQVVTVVVRMLKQISDVK
ncbi:S-layer homology domain-containing protein [Paenibacillus planticolens]|nr:S-layer homology domain-containing protein [Paenibacillus planticolens]